ncbi:MAG: radical SAM protein [Acidobacteria bacterium]|nr:radical SAM protein [Acidobacteriota bacterium]
MTRPLKVLLIRPKSTYGDVVAGIPIGLAMLAAVAERKGHQVRILDLGLESDAAIGVRRAFESDACDIAGIGCMSVEFLGGLETARLIRLLSPGTHVIFGGQHPTIMPDRVIEADCVDSVCIGEGEDTWAEFLDRFAARESLDGVEGLCFRRNGQTTRNLPRTTYVDVDALPMPAYHLLDLERYFDIDFVRFPTVDRRAIQIFTSRGCPYRCIYCHDLFGKRFRGRKPELVWEEIRFLHDNYGIREFMVEDDIFNMDLARAKRICDLVIESGLKLGFQFGNGVRLERFDEELMRKLAQAGTHHVAIAVESASDRIQRLIKKNLKLDRLNQVLDWAHRYGIGTLGFFMIGFPGEKVAEINQTIRFACASKFDEALFSIATPYAGTELNDLVRSTGSFEGDKDIDEDWEGVVRARTDEWDHRKLRWLQRKAYCLFFLTRFRFLKILMKMRSPRLFRRYWGAFTRNFTPFLGAHKSRIN